MGTIVIVLAVCIVALVAIVLFVVFKNNTKRKVDFSLSEKQKLLLEIETKNNSITKLEEKNWQISSEIVVYKKEIEILNKKILKLDEEILIFKRNIDNHFNKNLPKLNLLIKENTDLLLCYDFLIQCYLHIEPIYSNFKRIDESFKDVDDENKELIAKVLADALNSINFENIRRDFIEYIEQIIQIQCNTLSVNQSLLPTDKDFQILFENSRTEIINFYTNEINTLQEILDSLMGDNLKRIVKIINPSVGIKVLNFFKKLVRETVAEVGNILTGAPSRSFIDLFDATRGLFGIVSDKDFAESYQSILISFLEYPTSILSNKLVLKMQMLYQIYRKEDILQLKLIINQLSAKSLQGEDITPFYEQWRINQQNILQENQKLTAFQKEIMTLHSVDQETMNNAKDFGFIE